MKQILFAAFALSIFIFAQGAVALSLDKYSVETSLGSDLRAKTVLTMQFESPTAHIDYPLSFRAFNLKSENNFGQSDCRIQPRGDVSDISCDFAGMTERKSTVILTFESAEGISSKEDKFQYSVNYYVVFPTKETITTVKLPERSALSGDASKAFSPENATITTDGKNIILQWRSANLDIGNNLRFSISYSATQFEDTMGILIIVVIAIIILAFFATLIHSKKIKAKSGETVVSVLNTDEKIIFDIIKKYEGKVGQKILVRESNFSKAKVSRLIKEMKGRGMVDIEPISGRENRIIMKLKA